MLLDYKLCHVLDTSTMAALWRKYGWIELGIAYRHGTLFTEYQDMVALEPEIAVEDPDRAPRDAGRWGMTFAEGDFYQNIVMSSKPTPLLFWLCDSGIMSFGYEPDLIGGCNFADSSVVRVLEERAEEDEC